MPRHKGVWRDQWAYCDRCGFPHPISMLTKQKGLLLCSDHGCLDNLENERRPRRIAETLSDGREAENPKVEKQAEQDSFADLEF
jgi:hypothetical protein